MTRLDGAIFVCVTAGVAGLTASAGCSSSSNSAASTTDAGSQTPVVSATDSGTAGDGAVTIVTLQWAVGLVMNGPYVPSADGGAEGGMDDAAAPGEGGAGEGGTPEGGAAEGGSGETVAESDDAGPSDASFSQKVDGASLANLPPLPGVTVCVYQNSAIPCVTTQADGTFTLPGLPVRADIVISLQKTGYQSYLLPIETASTDMDGRSNPVIMSPTGGQPNLPFAIDLQTKGLVDAFAVSVSGAAMNVFAGTKDTQVTLAPASGNGPYFVNDDNQIDLSATSFVGSTALYYNVAPGTYTLTYSNPAYDCEPISFPFGQFGFPITSPAHSLKIVVAAGYVTGIVGALCTINPVIVAVDGG
jgi:hypothetical protein